MEQQELKEETNTQEQKPLCIDDVEDCDLREYARTMLDALSQENEQLIEEQKKLNEQIKKGDGYLNQLVILKSDFENFKRRNANATETAASEGKLFVIEKMLPILDTFDKARQMLSQREMATFDLVQRQFEKILSDVGVEKMEVLNLPFDPNFANAVHKQKVSDEKQDNVVIEVYQNGYKFGDKVLRYATVCVGQLGKRNDGNDE